VTAALKPTPLDFQLLHETFGDALDHVVDERAAQSVQSFRLRGLAVAADEQCCRRQLEARALRQFQPSLPFGPSTETFCPFTSTLTFGGWQSVVFQFRDMSSLIRLNC